MSTHIKHHIISHEGKPVAVVVPYDEYLELIDEDDETTIPHEVVMRYPEVSLIRAWREHLGLTQVQVAERIGMTQPAYQQIEDKDSKPRIATLKKVAEALGVEVKQLYV